MRNLLKNLLYSKFTGTTATRIGLKVEQVTIQEYILKKKERKNDGVIVTVKSSVKVKNVLYNKNTDLNQSAKTQKSFRLKIDNNKLSLKRNPNYYYQCQVLSQVSDLPWNDFV